MITGSSELSKTVPIQLISEESYDAEAYLKILSKAAETILKPFLWDKPKLS